jgi:hypothetical protein
MHEHECVNCGKEFGNVLWIDTLCGQCEKELWTSEWVEHEGLKIILPKEK